VIVVDGKAVIDIIDRHRARRSPHDVEMFHFLRELGIPTVVAVNKMDKVDDEDERLNDLCERLGLLIRPGSSGRRPSPPSAPNAATSTLNEAVRHHLHEQERDDLFKFFKPPFSP